MMATLPSPYDHLAQQMMALQLGSPSSSRVSDTASRILGMSSGGEGDGESGGGDGRGRGRGRGERSSGIEAAAEIATAREEEYGSGGSSGSAYRPASTGNHPFYGDPYSSGIGPAHSPMPLRNHHPHYSLPLMGGRRRGTCKFFNSLKGFGFVVDQFPDELGGQEVFCHFSAISGRGGFRSLAEGEEVEYELVQGPKGFQAASLTGPGGRTVVGDPKARLAKPPTFVPFAPSLPSSSSQYMSDSYQQQQMSSGLYNPSSSAYTQHVVYVPSSLQQQADSQYTYSSSLGGGGDETFLSVQRHNPVSIPNIANLGISRGGRGGANGSAGGGGFIGSPQDMLSTNNTFGGPLVGYPMLGESLRAGGAATQVQSALETSLMKQDLRSRSAFGGRSSSPSDHYQRLYTDLDHHHRNGNGTVNGSVNGNDGFGNGNGHRATPTSVGQYREMSPNRQEALFGFQPFTSPPLSSKDEPTYPSPPSTNPAQHFPAGISSGSSGREGGKISNTVDNYRFQISHPSKSPPFGGSTSASSIRLSGSFNSNSSHSGSSSSLFGLGGVLAASRLGTIGSLPSAGSNVSNTFGIDVDSRKHLSLGSGHLGGGGGGISSGSSRSFAPALFVGSPS